MLIRIEMRVDFPHTIRFFANKTCELKLWEYDHLTLELRARLCGLWKAKEEQSSKKWT
jgi:hypothetical protein